MVLTENHSFHFVSDYCYDLLSYFIIFNSHACEVKVQLILIRIMVLFVDYPLSLHMALFLSVVCLQFASILVQLNVQLCYSLNWNVPLSCFRFWTEFPRDCFHVSYWVMFISKSCSFLFLASLNFCTWVESSDQLLNFVGIRIRELERKRIKTNKKMRKDDDQVWVNTL